MKGKLYVCATPIGNLEDITLRVIRVLGEADLIAAEDTRRTRNLLNHLGIKKPLISCYQHNELKRKEEIALLLSEGKNIALVSDAGLPGISDPGSLVIRHVIDMGFEVEALPGPSAGITALVLTGYDITRFTFEGFLPQDKEKRAQRIDAIKSSGIASVLYEAPHKLLKTLEDLYKALGDVDITLARELTKLHEETVRTTLAAAVQLVRENPARGEYVLVLKAIEKQTREITDDELRGAAYKLIESGSSRKDAASEVAALYHVPKNRVYGLTIQNKE